MVVINLVVGDSFHFFLHNSKKSTLAPCELMTWRKFQHARGYISELNYLKDDDPVVLAKAIK